MGSVAGAGAVAGGAAGLGAGGVISRPRLFGRLAAQARVSVVSAPPGNGKTVLLRSWISGAGVAGRVAYVSAGRGERDPQQFWLSVLAALRQTAAGSVLVRAVTAAPDLDGWAIAERLLADLAPLDDRVWLVVDDVHELGPDALRQLELLMMRAPPGVRFVLATRHDVRLGLHRLRLEGELAEVREPDLRFTVAEASELFAAAGVELPTAKVAMLHERTEGWAAGCGWRRCRWPGTRTRAGSRPGLPAASGRWRSICWPRCWTGSPSRCGCCCCAPPSWSGSTGSWPTC
jgi:LuxR family maltose regulon positive regulatory protein